MELLVSLSLFSVVMLICVGTLLSIVDANRKAQSIRAVVDNVQSALESMSRNLRVGHDYDCDPSTAALDTCASGGTSMQFVDDQGADVEYRFNDASDRIERKVGSGSWVALTAPEALIDDMKFFITGVATDTEQPTVTIVIKAHSSGDPDTDTDFVVQTTITQRLFDI